MRILLPLLIVAAVALGGGGSVNPDAELLLLLLTAAAIPYVAAKRLPVGATLAADRPGWLAIGLVVAFPLLQVVPLPPGIWHALPGRGGARATLDALGESGHWLPVSLFPDQTIGVFLSLMPPLLVALVTATLPLARRIAGIWAILAATVVSACLGFIQFIAGPDRALSLYGEVHRGFAIGFFANRNAQGDLVAIGLCALLVLLRRHAHAHAHVPRPWGAAAAAIALLLLLAGVATGSRMGIAMLLVPAALGLWLFRERLHGGRTLGYAVAAGLGLAAIVGLAASGTALHRVSDRFTPDYARQRIWEDSVIVARAVAPVGAGMGGFVPLQQQAERLENVGATVANRAHNDYLELWIEGGIPALALLAGLAAFAGRRVWRAARSGDRDAATLAAFAGATFFIVALHSALDYPLRTLTHLTVVAFGFAGLLAPPLAPAGKIRRAQQPLAIMEGGV